MSDAEHDLRVAGVAKKVVRVTSAQVRAAKFKVARAAKTGRGVSRAVRAIANAKRTREEVSRDGPTG